MIIAAVVNRIQLSGLSLASGPMGCAGPQSLVAKSLLFSFVSPDVAWPRGPGGSPVRGQAAPTGGLAA